MFNWIKNLFGIKGEVTPLPDPEPQPTELIQKVFDWITSISKEDMISQRDDDYGVDITCLKWTEDGYDKTRYCLFQGNYDEEKIDKSIEIIRLESNKKDWSGCYPVSYFIMELKNGDVVMDKHDMFEDNLNMDNKKAFRSIFYYIQKLYELSCENINHLEHKKDMEEKYKNFTKNF
jgi:hypothetical protein